MPEPKTNRCQHPNAKQNDKHCPDCGFGISLPAGHEERVQLRKDERARSRKWSKSFEAKIAAEIESDKSFRRYAKALRDYSRALDQMLRTKDNLEKLERKQ